MIYSRNKPPKRWPQNENAPYHHDAIGGTEKLTNTSADFTGSRANAGNIFAPMPGKRAPNFGLALPTTDATLAPLLTANVAKAANFANACCTVAGAGYVATLATVATTATKKRTCTAAPRYGTMTTKPKGPVRRNTQSVEVTTPTVKRGFVMPEFLGHGHHDRTRMVYGHGVGYQQCCPHGYGRVSNRHAHPLRVETQPVVLYPVGAKTMQQVNLLARNTAPTKAAPAIIPTTDSASETQAFALLEATSSASLAAFYLRRGDVKAARRKAVQLLKSLQVLEVAHA